MRELLFVAVAVTVVPADSAFVAVLVCLFVCFTCW